jgi:hypothetical protein
VPGSWKVKPENHIDSKLLTEFHNAPPKPANNHSFDFFFFFILLIFQKLEFTRRSFELRRVRNAISEALVLWRSETRNEDFDDRFSRDSDAASAA